MGRTLLFLFFALLCQKSFAQVIVEGKDLRFDTHHLDELGKELLIRKNDTSLLAPNKYICNYTKKDKTYAISFVINSAGKPDGVVECEGLFKTLVNNGTIYRYERYQPGDHPLREEGFLRGDTAVVKNYNRYGQIRSEYWHLRNETIYDYNCSYDDATDSLSSCTLNDEVRGIYIQYREGGQVASKSITKNLPKGIRRQTEEFAENGKLSEKKIEYDNGKIKTIVSNGSYTITTPKGGGQNVEEYNKAGKLIRSYFSAYPSVPN